MNILPSIQRAYDDQFDINKKLESKVESIFISNKELFWHFEHRIKPLESFALKIEGGRFENPSKLEDFLACTLVVRNLKEIEKAVELVKQFFDITSRRPPFDEKTQKRPESFPFDDLRLYLKLKRDDALPPSPIEDIIFELQIKTFLQHAWTMATHDLTYKSGDINWGKKRVAFQIKAMLEHAELSIEAVNDLADSPAVAKIDKPTEELVKVKETLISLWRNEDLPKNLVGLCSTLSDFCFVTEINIDEIKQLIKEETENGRGTNIKSLSPYIIIIQVLLNNNNAKLKKHLASRWQKKKFIILIPNEITIPQYFNPIIPGKILRI